MDVRNFGGSFNRNQSSPDTSPASRADSSEKELSRIAPYIADRSQKRTKAGSLLRPAAYLDQG